MKIAINSNLFRLLVAFLFLSSCSPIIYEYSDERGVSRYLIYKGKYKYEERTSKGKINHWGEYEKTDSTISFIYPQEDELPFCFHDNIVKKIRKSGKVSKVSFSLKPSDESLPFAGVQFLGKDSNHIGYGQTDIDGVMEIIDNSPIHFLKLSYAGIPTLVIYYNPYKDYNIEIGIPNLRPGGRLNDECLVDWIDYLLDYKIETQNNTTYIERSGVKYELINKK